MTSRPRPTLSGHEISPQTEDDEKSMMVAKNFVSMMDNYSGWSPHELHEDAVMDWFGCCRRGRGSISYFLRSHIPKTRHVIEKVTKIPPIAHRLVKKSKSREAIPQSSSEPSTEECGQGDCKGLSTPENAVYPNLKEMVNAPRIKRLSSNTVDWEQCEFLEIRGKLEVESVPPFEMSAGKKLERIILAYTDQIHLVIYEAKNNCRKKLFS